MFAVSYTSIIFNLPAVFQREIPPSFKAVIKVFIGSCSPESLIKYHGVQKDPYCRLANLSAKIIRDLDRSTTSPTPLLMPLLSTVKTVLVHRSTHSGLAFSAENLKGSSVTVDVNTVLLGVFGMHQIHAFRATVSAVNYANLENYSLSFQVIVQGLFWLNCRCFAATHGLIIPMLRGWLLMVVGTQWRRCLMGSLKVPAINNQYYHFNKLYFTFYLVRGGVVTRIIYDNIVSGLFKKLESILGIRKDLRVPLAVFFGDAQQAIQLYPVYKHGFPTALFTFYNRYRCHILLWKPYGMNRGREQTVQSKIHSVPRVSLFRYIKFSWHRLKQELDVTRYTAQPNLINITNQHIGVAYCVDPQIDEKILSEEFFYYFRFSSSCRKQTFIQQTFTFIQIWHKNIFAGSKSLDPNQRKAAKQALRYIYSHTLSFILERLPRNRPPGHERYEKSEKLAPPQIHWGPQKSYPGNPIILHSMKQKLENILGGAKTISAEAFSQETSTLGGLFQVLSLRLNDEIDLSQILAINRFLDQFTNKTTNFAVVEDLEARTQDTTQKDEKLQKDIIDKFCLGIIASYHVETPVLDQRNKHF